MSQFATVIAVLALLGALASWIMGAVFYVRALRGSDRETRLLAVVAWPFARQRLTGAAEVHAGNLNKAIVAFFVCMTVAVASISVATNLARLSR